MTFFDNKATKGIVLGAIIFLILAISFSFIYYYVFYLPKNVEAKMEMESIESTARVEALAKCLDEAQRNYKKDLDKAGMAYKEAWYNECLRLGLPPDSPLPNDIAKRLTDNYKAEVERMDKAYENRKNDCFKFWQD